MEVRMSMDLLSRLPVDIVLHHVLSRLDYVSWVRAGAVSSSWNSLASQCPPPLGDNIPWIWLLDVSPTPKPEPNADAGRASYPLITSSAKGLGVGPSHDNYILVSFLLNHPGTDIDKVLYLYSTKTLNYFLLPIAGTELGQHPATAFFCPDQTSGKYTCNTPTCSWVAAAVAKYDATASGCDRDTTVKDLIFHKGELYCINQAREVVAFDVSQVVIQPPRVVVAGTENFKRSFLSSSTVYFLVESLYGELLIVENNRSKQNPIFAVHRVDKEEGKLVRVLDLGEEMLFVGGGCSRSILYGSRARNFPFFTHNCIYFFKHRGRTSRSYVHYDRYSVGKFSMENNNVVYCKDDFLNLMIVQPIWIPSNPSPTGGKK